MNIKINKFFLTTIFIWKYFVIADIYINTYWDSYIAPSQVMLLQKILKQGQQHM